jgi:hypothetical protein
MYRPDYTQRNYLHHNLPPVWDHKNVPRPQHLEYPNHYFMDEKSAHTNEHLQNSSSSISFGKSRKKLPIAVCVSLVILLIVGGAIAVSVYFTSLCK